MKTAAFALPVAFVLLLISNAAQAMPKDPAALESLINTEYGGDPVAYVHDNPKHFERMGCRGRADLLTVLMDAGLKLYNVDEAPRANFLYCAIMKERAEALTVVLDPDSLYLWEKAGYGSNGWTPLWRAIARDNHEITLLFLKNGAGIMFNRTSYLHLTREEHFVLAADWALKSRKPNAVQAFSDAGYGHIVEAARNESNVDYIKNRAGKGGRGNGSGLLGVVGLAAGVAIGGDVGTIIAATTGGLGGGDSDDEEAPTGSGPLPLATNRADLGLALSPTDAPYRGLKVLGVGVDGPGATAGVLEEDVITRIAGVPVATPSSYYVATEKAAKTETFDVDYYRGEALATTTFGLPKPASTSAQTDETDPKSTSVLDELERLADLRDRGVLTDEEFEALKAEILEQD